jgi:nitrile hydratase beta subunit-like protein
MTGVHDMGGSPGGPVHKSQHETEDWERLADAVNIALGIKGLKTTDEHRRAMESLENYRELGYYERWVAATEKLLVEKGILTRKEVDERSAEIKRRWGGAR